MCPWRKKAAHLRGSLPNYYKMCLWHNIKFDTENARIFVTNVNCNCI